MCVSVRACVRVRPLYWCEPVTEWAFSSGERQSIKQSITQPINQLIIVQSTSVSPYSGRKRSVTQNGPRKWKKFATSIWSKTSSRGGRTTRSPIILRRRCVHSFSSWCACTWTSSWTWINQSIKNQSINPSFFSWCACCEKSKTWTCSWTWINQSINQSINQKSIKKSINQVIY